MQRSLEDISFHEISREKIVESIKNETIQEIYSKFSFQDINIQKFNERIKEKDIKNLVLGYIQEYNFLTYEISKIKENDGIQIANLVICTEDKCFVINSIGLDLISDIVNEIEFPMINLSQNSKDVIPIEEATNFYKHFYKKFTESDQFVAQTIKPISSYIIRRFYYPSDFFDDSSFFLYKSAQKTIDQYIETGLEDLFFITKSAELEDQFESFSNSIEAKINGHHSNPKDNKQIYEFDVSEFIILRNIDRSINLCIHIPTLFLFVVKKFQYSIENDKLINHEKEFCTKHSHRCFTRFYGFVYHFVYDNITNQKVRKEFGAVYEFMSNDNLLKYVLSNGDAINELFSLTVLNRLIQAIDYLASQNLIHRDLKPENILIDHDFNVFIHDFETVREVNSKDEYTLDFGSAQYESPEQCHGKGEISFPTDIFSLGQIIYFIFEKKHRFQGSNKAAIDSQLLSNKPTKMERGPQEIRDLFQRCVKFNPEERPTIKEVKERFIKLNSFEFIEQYLIELDSKNVSNTDIIHYFTQNLIINSDNIDRFHKYLNYISLLLQLLSIKDEAKGLCMLGLAYKKGEQVEKNYSKALEYFKSASDLGNSDGLYYIAMMHYFGEGVECDAKKCFIYLKEAALKKNCKALFQVGQFYYHGIFYPQNYLTAKELFESAAAINNPDAFFYLGLMYYHGKGVAINYSDALYYLQQASHYKNAQANFLLGVMYFYGRGVAKDYKKAREYFEKGGKLNDSNSFVNLGNIYDEGYGVEKDHKKAFEYYQKSSKLNNSLADFMIGVHYLNGLGVSKDVNEAKKYFEISASKKNNKAQNALGCLFYNEKNYISAKYYFELAANQNNPNSLIGLGLLYFNGFGAERDYKKAFQYFKSAANMNDPRAFYNLGVLYYLGFGVEQNYQKAKNYFEASASYNDPDACLCLGILHQEGKGVPQNYNSAINYYKLAAQRGVASAYVQLGKLCFEGKGCKKDFEHAKFFFENAALIDQDCYYYVGLIYYVKKKYTEAKTYFEIAAANGFPMALANLGNLYLEGFGVDKNISKAKEYLNEAAKMNEPNSLLNLGYIYYYGLDGVVDYLRAKYYYELCAKQGNTFAYYALGLLYLHGYGVQQDCQKAIEYFELSSKHNNPMANNMLGIIYLEGDGVPIDHLKAKHYFELASFESNSSSLYQLGLFYYKQGKHSERNYVKARECFNMAAEKRNPIALFYLGFIYENGKGVEKDIKKAIEYYLKSTENHYFQDKSIVEDSDNISQASYKSDRNNFNYYRSNNDLGLIYVTEKEFQNKELARKYLQEAGNNEYPFGQNNYGLFYQFYLNDKERAFHMFNRSSKHQFAMAEFNLAHFYEQEGEIDESIKHYELVSQYENVAFTFRGQLIDDDERLNVSKMFLTCFANLKLTLFYLNKIETAQEYLMKSIFQPLFRLLVQPTRHSYSFTFKCNHQNGGAKITNLKDFYLNFPLFNLQKKFEPNNVESGWKKNEYCSKDKKIILNFENESHSNELQNKNGLNDYKKKNVINNSDQIADSSLIDRYQNIELIEKVDNILKNMKIGIKEQEFRYESQTNMNTIQFKLTDDNINLILQYPNDLHDKFLKIIDEYKLLIQDIILEMNSIVYNPPYCVLFGRIPIEQEIKKNNEINQLFYEGFLLDQDS